MGRQATVGFLIPGCSFIKLFDCVMGRLSAELATVLKMSREGLRIR